MKQKFIEEKFKLLFQGQLIEYNDYLNKDHNIFKEFFRSLKLYSIIDAEEISSKEEEDILIDFFKEIVSIEMLIRGKEYSPRDEFSVRCCWLLGKNEKQLEILQNILGTLYSLRNSISHTLFLPKNNKNFDKLFNKDIVEAIIIANKLHRLILLRHLLPKGGLIKKRDLICEFKKLKIKRRISAPESFYSDIITKEIEQITGIESVKDEDIISGLPEKTNCFYWGINTYGGFVIEPHKITGDEHLFYEDGVAIIPEEKIWRDLTFKIKKEIKHIKKEGYKNLKIVSKTHHSVLFFLGYMFYKAYRINLTIDFDGKEFFAYPLKDSLQPKEFWKIKNFELNGTENEAILILNVSSYVCQSIEEDLNELGIDQLPKIELEYMCGEDKIKPNSFCFSKGDEIKKACRALDLFLAHNEKTRNLQKIHLFSEARGVMMLLLGMHFRLQKKDIVLYEHGLRKAEDQERHYYRVFACEYKR
ncbi:MAG: SAVED domain-containing protein [Candidatus Heimdallarchaeaceae archaeon]